MTELLILVLIALFGIALWQMSKILKLSSGAATTDDSQIANDKDNNINGKLMLMFVAFLYVILLASFWLYNDFFLPNASSAHGPEYDRLMLITALVIIAVQFLTQGLLYWFAYKYRGKKGQKALFYADNHKLEFIWTIIPVIVLAGLIIYGLYTWVDIMEIDEESGDPLIVEIYAKQFGWQARYSGEDKTLGDANVRFIEGVNILGVDPSDPDGKDDVVASELHLPVDRPVIFKFRSQDVLHSAYFPFFRAQMNVVPGMITQFQFTPTVTSEDIKESRYMTRKVRKINEIRRERSLVLEQNGEVGLDPYEFEYYLLCNKICGSSHYNMQMKIVVEEAEEFDEWMAEQKTLDESLASAL